MATKLLKSILLHLKIVKLDKQVDNQCMIHSLIMGFKSILEELKERKSIVQINVGQINVDLIKNVDIHLKDLRLPCSHK